MELIQVDYRDIHAKLWELVESLWTPNAIFGHGVDHAFRTYQHAVQIAENEGANALITGAACLLMDVGLNLIDGRRNHIQRSLDIAVAVIRQIEGLQAVSDDLITAISYHEGDEARPERLPKETLIVRDADTLDRMGFSGISMTLRYGTWINRPLCSLVDPTCAGRRPELDSFSLDYIRFLFTLAGTLSTKSGHTIGAHKMSELQKYVSCFDEMSKVRLPTYFDAFVLVEQLTSAKDGC